MASQPSFTGRSRRRRTRWSVRFGDTCSRVLITGGGIGTILAVSTVFLFLLWVVAPLLSGAKVDPRPELPAGSHPARAIQVGADEYRLLGWTLHEDGHLVCYRLDDGDVVAELDLFSSAEITSFSFVPDGTSVGLGFSDGKVAVGRIGFKTSYLDREDASPALQALPVGGHALEEGAAFERVSPSQFRAQRLQVEFGEASDGGGDAAVHLLDHVETDAGITYAFLDDAGVLRFCRVTQRENMLTGEISYRTRKYDVPFDPTAYATTPERLLLSGLGDAVILTWRDGRLQRFNTRVNPSVLEETTDILAEEEEELTSVEWLLGRTTLLAGDTTGRVAAWFPVRMEGEDGLSEVTRMVTAHTYQGPSGAPVTDLASAHRIRMFGAGYADGAIRLYHATSGKILGDLAVPGPGGDLHGMAFTPKDDGFTALSPSGLGTWDLDPRYPEATPHSLFRPVWYEGAAQPEHVWQSSAATDDFEPKFGLMPLVFGTLKATVFSLLFGVPIALLAAIFTSEFLDPRVRERIKPVVELMASLPSVVLGFLAALVFAPMVGENLAFYLLLGVALPLSFLLGAQSWQLLPRRVALRAQSWRFPAMFLAIPVGIGMALLLAPAVERWCFAGDMMRWLDGQIGHAVGGWIPILIPLAAVLVIWMNASKVNPWLRRVSRDWSWRRCGLADFVKFGASLLLVLALATLAALVLNSLGLDPRGGLVDTYVQRNALVVGFVMGFAIIPIIYTIAEDALSAVPDHLRSASLGAGATPWQTALRVVVPTATSGLFSAIMIGLGRAVGETMVVLMAAGNTPVMEWNIFNGFRTLSANIAVELPEAVRNSTHYRTLFLAALTLFCMTFVLNTAAEIVRMRFRKKTVEL